MSGKHGHCTVTVEGESHLDMVKRVVAVGRIRVSAYYQVLQPVTEGWDNLSTQLGKAVAFGTPLTPR
jgi:hypothetical protein